MKKIIISLICLIVICIPAFAKKETKKSEQTHRPYVLTFYKKDCEECNALEMTKEDIIKEYGKKVDFIKLDIAYEDCDFKKLKAKYNVKNAPTTLFVNIDEGITKKKEGFISYSEYKNKIKAILSE